MQSAALASTGMENAPMIRLIPPLLSLPLLGLTLGLGACSGDSQDQTAETVGDVAVTGSGITVDVLPTNSWNGGFNGAVRITDTAFPSPITSFQVVFTLGGGAGVTG